MLLDIYYVMSNVFGYEPCSQGVVFSLQYVAIHFA